MRAWFRRQFGKGEPRRYLNEQIFWRCNIPAVLMLYMLDRPLWDRVSILYLALVSIYALDATFGGAKEAAKAKREAQAALNAGGDATDAIDAATD